MIGTALLWVTTAPLLGTTAWRARRAVDIPLLVPLAWLVLIPLPAIVRGGALGFHGEARDALFISIAIANVGFVLFQVFVDNPWFEAIQRALVGWWVRDENTVPADSSERSRTSAGGETAQDRAVVRYWFAGLLVVSASLALWHLALMPHIPAIEVLRGVNDPVALAQARENAAKLLPVSALVKYAFTWNGHVLLPILLCTAFLFRWRWQALVVAVFGLLYLMSTLEKSPSMLFVLSPFLALAIRNGRRLWSPVVIGGLVVSLVPVLVIAQAAEIGNTIRAPLGISAAAPSAGASPESALTPTSGITLGTSVHHLTDLVFRRIGTGPVDVAYAWFSYFPAHHPFLRGSGWEPWRVLSSNYQSPANMVGLWAFYGQRNYPISSLRAYATFIADGWAEFGYLGVLMATLILLGICGVMELMRGWTSRWFCLACYVPAMVVLTASVASAGVLAILFSLGTFLCPLIAAAYLVTSRRVRRLAPRPALARQPSLPG